ncbi:hypothetical protein HOC00_05630, partial [Candidatus Peregrinibacteria bacterium]|nr:hypothetical protein [Candidatus Peregrinibacteria bacterium]
MGETNENLGDLETSLDLDALGEELVKLASLSEDLKDVDQYMLESYVEHDKDAELLVAALRNPEDTSLRLEVSILDLEQYLTAAKRGYDFEDNLTSPGVGIYHKVIEGVYIEASDLDGERGYIIQMEGVPNQHICRKGEKFQYGGFDDLAEWEAILMASLAAKALQTSIDKKPVVGVDNPFAFSPINGRPYFYSNNGQDTLAYGFSTVKFSSTGYKSLDRHMGKEFIDHINEEYNAKMKKAKPKAAPVKKAAPKVVEEVAEEVKNPEAIALSEKLKSMTEIERACVVSGMKGSKLDNNDSLIRAVLSADEWMIGDNIENVKAALKNHDEVVAYAIDDATSNKSIGISAEQILTALANENPELLEAFYSQLYQYATADQLTMFDDLNAFVGSMEKIDKTQYRRLQTTDDKFYMAEIVSSETDGLRFKTNDSKEIFLPYEQLTNMQPIDKNQFMSAESEPISVPASTASTTASEAPAPRPSASVSSAAPRPTAKRVEKPARNMWEAVKKKNGGFTYNPTNAAENAIRIEKVVGKLKIDKDAVLTSSAYKGKEFAAHKGSYYEKLANGTFGSQRLVLRKGDGVSVKKAEAPKVAEADVAPAVVAAKPEKKVVKKAKRPVAPMAKPDVVEGLKGTVAVVELTQMIGDKLGWNPATRNKFSRLFIPKLGRDSIKDLEVNLNFGVVTVSYALADTKEIKTFSVFPNNFELSDLADPNKMKRKAGKALMDAMFKSNPEGKMVDATEAFTAEVETKMESAVAKLNKKTEKYAAVKVGGFNTVSNVKAQEISRLTNDISFAVDNISDYDPKLMESINNEKGILDALANAERALEGHEGSERVAGWRVLRSPKMPVTVEHSGVYKKMQEMGLTIAGDKLYGPGKQVDIGDADYVYINTSGTDLYISMRMPNNERLRVTESNGADLLAGVALANFADKYRRGLIPEGQFATSKLTLIGDLSGTKYAAEAPAFFAKLDDTPENPKAPFRIADLLPKFKKKGEEEPTEHVADTAAKPEQRLEDIMGHVATSQDSTSVTIQEYETAEYMKKNQLFLQGNKLLKSSKPISYRM